MYEKYETTKYLSFRATCDAYWCKDGSIETRLPFSRWRFGDEIARFDLAMTPTEQRTEVFVKGEQVFTYLRRDGRYYEYKWPHNGVLGMYTDYPVQRDEPRGTRLTRGVGGGVLCFGGVFLQSWLGAEAHQIMWHKEAVDSGEWIGSIELAGELCDVVFWDRQAIERWDAYYVNAEGLMLMLVSANFDVEDDKCGLTTVIKVRRYTDISTSPISPETLTPSQALIERTKTWRKLSEAESLAEMEVE